MSYILPQVQVFQIFRRLPQNVVKNLNAFVFGPHYQLFRFSNPSEKPLINVGTFDNSSDVTYSWPNKPVGSFIDFDYVKVYLEDVWAKYFSINNAAKVVSDDNRNQIRIESLVLKSGNGYNRSSGLPPVSVGDRIMYSYTLGEDKIVGVSKIVGFVADTEPAAVDEAAPKDSNQPSLDGTDDLDIGNGSIFAAASGNTNPFSDSKVYALSGFESFPGSLAAKVLEDTITIRITTGGDAGTARATVEYGSGAYRRTSVPIESVGSNQGRLYLGNFIYVDFKAGSGEGTTFVEGDIYTVSIQAPFVKLTDSHMNSGGTFLGPKDTTYVVSVVRGGVFDRVVTVTPGVSCSRTDATLSVNPGSPSTPNWDKWLGGDVNDEYVLRCTVGGTIANARFSLTSLAGDNMSNIAFAAENTAVEIGGRGLVASFDLANANDQFTVGDTWIIRVNACRPMVRVTDTRGIDSTMYAVVSSHRTINLGYLGATLTFLSNPNTEGVSSNGGLLKDDVYYVAATAERETAYRTLLLADDVNSAIPSNTTLDNVSFFIVRDNVQIDKKRIQSPPSYNWLADENGITLYSGLQIQDDSIIDNVGNKPWLPVSSASVYVEYRALLTNYSDSIRAMEDLSDVATTLGVIHPDNPLAQGVYNAMLNSGSRVVYYMSIPSNDLNGWLKVLDVATISSDVYAFVPLTKDSEVIEAVVGHINQMSTEITKRWRLAFISRDLPRIDKIYDRSSHPSGEEYLATIELDPVTGKYTLLRFVDEDNEPSDLTQCLTTLRPGSKIRINFASNAWGEETFDEYEISTVLTNSSVRLKSGPASEIDVPTKVEAYNVYTLNEMADAYGKLAYGYFNRRIYMVFPPYLTSGGIVQSGEFGAAAIAGLVSSVPPQQPLTNIEVLGFDDLPFSYQLFTTTQLNKMAEYGVLILMQESVGGRVYVRHQVSTKAKDGNLNETELSIVKNLDSISYYFAARFEPYIGRYNITPDLLNMLETILRDGLSFLGSKTDFGLLGPQIILDNTEVVAVQQHPELKDHVLMSVNIELPKPFNVLQLRLVV